MKNPDFHAYTLACLIFFAVLKRWLSANLTIFRLVACRCFTHRYLI